MFEFLARRRRRRSGLSDDKSWERFEAIFKALREDIPEDNDIVDAVVQMAREDTSLEDILAPLIIRLAKQRDTGKKLNAEHVREIHRLRQIITDKSAQIRDLELDLALADGSDIPENLLNLASVIARAEKKLPRWGWLVRRRQKREIQDASPSHPYLASVSSPDFSTVTQSGSVDVRGASDPDLALTLALSAALARTGQTSEDLVEVGTVTTTPSGSTNLE